MRDSVVVDAGFTEPLIVSVGDWYINYKETFWSLDFSIHEPGFIGTEKLIITETDCKKYGPGVIYFSPGTWGERFQPILKRRHRAIIKGLTKRYWDIKCK